MKLSLLMFPLQGRKPIDACRIQFHAFHGKLNIDAQWMVNL